jgi:hypothetical protein
MRLPRFRLPTLMLAIALLAGLFGWLLRPHPVLAFITADHLKPFTNKLQMICWYDCSMSEVSGSDARCFKKRNYGPLLAVDWSDGSVSWYVRR